MFQKNVLWHKLVALLLVMMLIIPIMVACGGDDDDVETTTPPETATTTVTTTPKVTTPTSNEGPVKIGAIAPWSGPMAISGLLADPIIKLVEWQVKQQGGILGGREIEIIKYDGKGQVAEDAAGAQKLILDDKVSVLVFGGAYGSEQSAVSTVAEKYQTLFLAYGDIPEIAQNKFTVCSMIERYKWADYWLRLAKMLNAKTVAIMGTDSADVHERNAYAKDIMEAAGIEIVYEQYISGDTKDFSPYLTKIKYLAPDVVCWDASNEGYTAIGRQIMELGGWGKTTLLSMTQAATAATMTKGFEGSYVLVAWMPGLNTPGGIKFEQDYKTLNGGVPNPNHIYYYNTLWTAIKAIEMAGTDADRVKIAEAIRSGKLEWDTPVGRAHFTTDGYSGLGLTAMHVEGGKLVPVVIPE